MQKIGRIVLAWIAATVLALVIASIGHSLSVQSELAALGVSLPFGVRITQMAQDIFGLLPSLGLVILIGFAIAFALAAWLKRRRGRIAATLAYPLAGLAAIAVALLLMRLAFSLMPLAGARNLTGVAMMLLAGAAGGALFGWLARNRPAPA